jgi:branched-subunit amino acid transport protein
MIDPVLLWPMLFGMGLITIMTRTAFLWLPEHWQPRGQAGVALSFVPALALVAIVTPGALGTLRQTLLAPEGFQVGSALLQIAQDGRLPSALVVIFVGAWRRNAMQALIAGVIVFGALRATF